MDAARAGHFWKLPFVWESGDRLPAAGPSLAFEPVDPSWLEWALAEVMAHSVDESDQFVVAKHGAQKACRDLLDECPQHFERPAGWWQAAIGPTGERIGFALPVLFKLRAEHDDGRPQATLFYLGVLPAHRSLGVGSQLLAQATRTCVAAGFHRILCDTSASNEPMIRAFRTAGYSERPAWQRPLE